MAKTFSLTGEPSRIAERMQHSHFQSFILVVPTKRRMRYLIRQLLAEHGSSAPEPLLFTLGILAWRVFHFVSDSKRLAEGSVQSLLFHQALVDTRKRLTYFRIRERYPFLPMGTFDKIVNVIRKLKETGVTPAALEEEIALDDSDEQAKLRDVFLIYSAYEKRLEAMNAIDPEGIFHRLDVECTEHAFRRSFEHLFPHLEEIAIVGFNEFTEPEIGFIQKLCSLSLQVSLEFDFEAGNPALFGQLEQNYQRFCELGFRSVLPAHPRGGGPSLAESHSVDPFRRAPSDSQIREIHLHLASNLFKREEVTPKKNCAPFITLARTADRVREVQFICSLIKYLALARPDRDLSRICVAMYSPQVYTHLMREQFRKFGIPANITDRYHLAQAPVVASIVGLLNIAVRGYQRDDVVRTVGSSYFDFRADGKTIDAANLAGVSRDARIVGGVRSWHTRIERRLETLRHSATERDDERELRTRTTQITNLEKAQRDIRALEHYLHHLSGDQTPGEFRRNLELLLEELRLPFRIVATGPSELVEKDARAYARFLEVLEQTVHLLEYQEGKQTRHPLRSYVEHLKVALSQERYNVREQHGQGVLVTSIEETRGLPIDVMIVAGLVDGEFPSVYQSELFFTAKRLKEREQRHRWENRYLFYQAITNWSEHLYLTYPEQDGDLDLVRSTFVDALMSVATVEEWEYPHGVSPLSGAIYSEEELLQHYGRSVAAGFAHAQIPPTLQNKTSRIQEAIAVDRSRVQLHNLPEYEGLIFSAVSDEAREALQKLKHRVYSVSQLERYGKCPFQFFAQRLLHLTPSEELEEELSPLEKGSILHEIFFEFYTERRDQNLPAIMDCTEEKFTQAHRRLLEIAEAKLNTIDIPGAFWELEKELILGDKQTARGLLSEFLDFERSRATSLRPRFFEVGFGSALGAGTRTDRTFSTEEPIVAGNVHLRGKIDRVELDEEVFAVVDYKVGSNLPRLSDIQTGISLQLPLYLYTIEQLLHGTHVPAGAAYYQVRKPVALKLGIGSARRKKALGVQNNTNLFPDDEELRHVIDKAIAFVNRYVDAMAEGKFPLTTSDKIDKVCGYCDFKRICRIQTVRHLTSQRVEEQ